MDTNGNPTPLDDHAIRLIVIGILLKRLGGRAHISQGDVDEIAYNTVKESGFPDGSIVLDLQPRQPQG